MLRKIERIKCNHCGEIFENEMAYGYDGEDLHGDDEISITPIINKRGIPGLCPNCRKYEIMIKYKIYKKGMFMNIEEELKEFTKVGKIKDWQKWIKSVPQEKGVYVITRESKDDPEFVNPGTGAFLKDKGDPNVSIEELSEEWYHSNCKIMYIGRVGDDTSSVDSRTLKIRIEEYMRFGEKEPKKHWGGRYIWQLKDARELNVWYKVCDTPQTIKELLIKKYRPFANLQVKMEERRG